MLQEVKLDIILVFLATKFAFNLIVLNFGIKVWKSAQMQCLQELVDSRRHLLQSFYMDMYMSYSTKMIKDKNVLVSYC